MGLVYAFTKPKGNSFERGDLKLLKNYAQELTMGCTWSLLHKKAQQPDILDELLSGNNEFSTSETSNLHELINLTPEQSDYNKSIERVLPQIEQKSLNKYPVKEVKKKSTCYLTKQNFTRLDQAKEQTRELIAQADRTLASKSHIINISLDLVLQDFEKNSENSFLAQYFKQKQN